MEELQILVLLFLFIYFWAPEIAASSGLIISVLKAASILKFLNYIENK